MNRSDENRKPYETNTGNYETHLGKHFQEERCVGWGQLAQQLVNDALPKLGMNPAIRNIVCGK